MWERAKEQRVRRGEEPPFMLSCIEFPRLARLLGNASCGFSVRGATKPCRSKISMHSSKLVSLPNSNVYGRTAAHPHEISRRFVTDLALATLSRSIDESTVAQRSSHRSVPNLTPNRQSSRFRRLGEPTYHVTRCLCSLATFSELTKLLLTNGQAEQEVEHDKRHDRT